MIEFRRGASQTTILLVEKYKNVDTMDQEGKVFLGILLIEKGRESYRSDLTYGIGI